MTHLTATPSGQIIRQTLREQGRSIRWLASQLDWSEDSLQHALAGRRPLSPERIRAAAKVLGIPEFVLFAA